MVRSGDLGRLYYLYTTRVNLGKVRAAESALWDLAPHDISIIRFLTDAKPIHVSAQGGTYLRPGLEDVVFATITFEGGVVANLHVSWLDPHKVRRVTVVGDRRMAVFDDMEPTEKIRIIDKGIDTTEYYESFQDAITERIGDIRIPPVAARGAAQAGGGALPGLRPRPHDAAHRRRQRSASARGARGHRDVDPLRRRRRRPGRRGVSDDCSSIARPRWTRPP